MKQLNTAVADMSGAYARTEHEGRALVELRAWRLAAERRTRALAARRERAAREAARQGYWTR